MRQRPTLADYLANPGAYPEIELQGQRRLGRRVLRPGGEQIARGLFGRDITRYQAPDTTPQTVPQWAHSANRMGLLAEHPSGWGEGLVPPRPVGPGGVVGANTQPLRMSVTQAQALLPPVTPQMAQEAPAEVLPPLLGTYKPWMETALPPPVADPWSIALQRVRARQMRGPDKTLGEYVRSHRPLTRPEY